MLDVGGYSGEELLNIDIDNRYVDSVGLFPLVP